MYHMPDTAEPGVTGGCYTWLLQVVISLNNAKKTRRRQDGSVFHPLFLIKTIHL